MLAKLVSIQLVLALAGALSTGSCSAQNSATAQSSGALSSASSEKSRGAVSSPVFADGDEFEIRLPFATAKALQLPEDLVMVAKHDENLTMFASAGSAQAEDGVFTIWFDPRFCIVHIRATVFESRMRPCDQTARFPLAVGKTWTAQFEVTQFGQRGASEGGNLITATGTVSDIEQVTVPAGTFQAYRIDVRLGGTPRTTLWYAPSPVGFYVKTQSNWPTGLNFDLVGYHRVDRSNKN
jgi:hypothetical protein